MADEITLHEHEERSEARAEKVLGKIHELKEGSYMAEDNTAAIIAAMMGGRGYDGAGVGAGAGAGLGAGLLGGLLGGTLFGNGGFGNNRNGFFNGEQPVTATQLSSAINGVTDNNNVTTILQTLGDIKAAVPLAEGQVQLALAGAQADINANINSSLQVAIAGQAGINKNISEAIATSLASQSQIKDLVLSTTAGLQLQASQNTASLTTAIRDDGDRTRALLISQNDALLNRQLAVAEAALLEQRAITRGAATEVNVTQTVNQVQAQAQAQQQQQQQLVLLAQIAAGFQGLQNAVATNSNLIVGNTGAVATGPQTANPVNVKA